MTNDKFLNKMKHVYETRFYSSLLHFRKINNFSKMPKLLIMAANIALPDHPYDPRNFTLGAVGVRRDGVIVHSKNGAPYSTHYENYHLIPSSHAEGRVLRKLGNGGIVYVSRVSKAEPISEKISYAMAMPCPMCQIRLKAFKTQKVYYSINDNQYGVWIPKTDQHTVFNI